MMDGFRIEAQGQMSQRAGTGLWKSAEWAGVAGLLQAPRILKKKWGPREGMSAAGSPVGFALRRRPSAEWSWFLFSPFDAAPSTRFACSGQALKGPLFHGDVGAVYFAATQGLRVCYGAVLSPPPGLVLLPLCPHALRRRLHSFAASRLFTSQLVPPNRVALSFVTAGQTRRSTPKRGVSLTSALRN